MNWYDRARIYDALFSWSPAGERDFVLGASERWGLREPRRILEPFCGSGRLLRVMPGVAVGFDLNPHMVRYAASLGARVFRADAARFAVRPRSFDLAFCLIDSFRHLPTEAAASSHLRAVARALRPGAVYVLGFEVAGHLPGGGSVEEWEAEHDGVSVKGRMQGLGDADPATRIETGHFRMESAGEVIESFSPLRTYTPRQVEDLIDDEASFEIAAVFGGGYDLGRPVEISQAGASALLVLQRT